MKLGYLKVLFALVLTISFSYITPVYAADSALEMVTTTATPSTATGGTGTSSGSTGGTVATHNLPTVSEWGMIVFAILLLIAGAVSYHRQKLFQ